METIGRRDVLALRARLVGVTWDPVLIVTSGVETFPLSSPEDGARAAEELDNI
jgi:hypothetical protein